MTNNFDEESRKEGLRVLLARQNVVQAISEPEPESMRELLERVRDQVKILETQVNQPRYTEII